MKMAGQGVRHSASMSVLNCEVVVTEVDKGRYGGLEGSIGIQESDAVDACVFIRVLAEEGILLQPCLGRG